VTCVFCGHEYPTGTPRTQAKLLAEHVADCPKHPAAAFKRRAEAAEAELVSVLTLSPEKIEAGAIAMCNFRAGTDWWEHESERRKQEYRDTFVAGAVALGFRPPA